MALILLYQIAMLAYPITASDSHIEPSELLFQPQAGKLHSCRRHVTNHLDLRARAVATEIKNLISKKDYPCIAAIKSYHRDEYHVGLYQKFGQGWRSRELRNDLLYFLQIQKEKRSPYLSFWAVFDDRQPISEKEFEIRLWDELSFLTSQELRETDWPLGTDYNPNNKSFSFCIGGSKLFVVGMHSLSSRISRRFPWPALVFNSFDQFELLKEKDQFWTMVQTNRMRDKQLQGKANPMAIEWGEIWESIQFSGKENPSTWKCPFHFMKGMKKIFS